LVLFVVYLLSKALWVQMDITGEFRNGAVSLEKNKIIILLLVMLNIVHMLSTWLKWDKTLSCVCLLIGIIYCD